MFNYSSIPQISDLSRCRLCFENQTLLIHIFETTGSLNELARTISEVLNFEVSAEDHFPPYVCSYCSTKLFDFKAFKAKCYSLRETYKLILQRKAESVREVDGGMPVAENMESKVFLERIVAEPNHEEVSLHNVSPLLMKVGDAVVGDGIGASEQIETEQDPKASLYNEESIPLKVENTVNDDRVKVSEQFETEQKSKDSAFNVAECPIKTELVEDEAEISKETENDQIPERHDDSAQSRKQVWSQMNPTESEAHVSSEQSDAEDVPESSSYHSDGYPISNRKLGAEGEAMYSRTCSSVSEMDLLLSNAAVDGIGRQYTTTQLCFEGPVEQHHPVPSVSSNFVSDSVDPAPIEPLNVTTVGKKRLGRPRKVKRGRPKVLQTTREEQRAEARKRYAAKNRHLKRAAVRRYSLLHPEENIEAVRRNASKRRDIKRQSITSQGLQNPGHDRPHSPASTSWQDSAFNVADCLKTELVEDEMFEEAEMYEETENDQIPEDVADDQLEGIDHDTEVFIKDEMNIVEWEMPQDMLPKEDILENDEQQQDEIQPEKDTSKVSAGIDFRHDHAANNGLTKELEESQFTEFWDINSSECLWQMNENFENVSSINNSSVASTSGMSGKNNAKEEMCEEGVKNVLFAEKESLFSLKSKSGDNSANSGSSCSRMAVLIKRKRFVCDVCKKSFDTKQILKHHERVHYDVRPFKCRECGKSFKQKNTKTVHELTHLKKQKENGRDKKRKSKKRLVCKICKKEFNSQSSFYKHSNLHKNKFSCPYCEKRFGSKYHLEQHLRVHTNEKPYSCEVCNRTFNWKGSLNIHVETHNRSFQCNVCDKKFKTKQQKNNHELIHLRGK